MKCFTQGQEITNLTLILSLIIFPLEFIYKENLKAARIETKDFYYDLEVAQSNAL